MTKKILFLFAFCTGGVALATDKAVLDAWIAGAPQLEQVPINRPTSVHAPTPKPNGILNTPEFRSAVIPENHVPSFNKKTPTIAPPTDSDFQEVKDWVKNKTTPSEAPDAQEQTGSTIQEDPSEAPAPSDAYQPSRSTASSPQSDDAPEPSCTCVALQSKCDAILEDLRDAKETYLKADAALAQGAASSASTHQSVDTQGEGANAVRGGIFSRLASSTFNQAKRLGNKCARKSEDAFDQAQHYLAEAQQTDVACVEPLSQLAEQLEKKKISCVALAQEAAGVERNAEAATRTLDSIATD